MPTKLNVIFDKDEIKDLLVKRAEADHPNYIASGVSFDVVEKEEYGTGPALTHVLESVSISMTQKLASEK